MNKNNYLLLRNLCILIIIILIIRYLYKRIYTNKNNFEGFEINNNDAIDLLTKNKSSEVIDTNSVPVPVIKPWTTKIYNLQGDFKDTQKSIAFYQPSLTINSEEYCKLGDIVSQNSDYSLPTSTQQSLLIKKNSSDVRAPVNYDLIVDYGDEYINDKYYNYETMITDVNKINSIKDNIKMCANTFIDLNAIIQQNKNILQTNLSSKLFTDSKMKIKIGSDELPLSGLLNNNSIIKTITDTTVIEIPAGISGSLETITRTGVFITIPETIDTKQINNTSHILANLPSVFKNFTDNNIEIKPFTYNLFHLVPVMSIVNYLSDICQTIKTIYDINQDNIELLNELNLCSSITTLYTVVDKIELFKSFIYGYDAIEKITLHSNPEITSYYNEILDASSSSTSSSTSSTSTKSLLSLILDTLQNTEITYHMTFLNFVPSKFTDDIAQINSRQNLSTGDNNKINKIILTNFENNILSNMPEKNYNILYNDVYQSQIISTTLNIKKFSKFQSDLDNNKIQNLPLKIYKPIAPPKYRVLGHVFCNTKKQLNEVIKPNAEAGKGVCCIPEQCLKEMRPWFPSDKIFEYSKNNNYWAIYLNPYTNTFISTNRNQLPEGKVYKVVACVKKCSAVEELKKADECIRDYYAMNKKSSQDVNVAHNLVSNEEDEYYLSKLQSQSNKIATLSKKAQDMQLTIDKANIVNREMNKQKLQDYVDKQKYNIDSITKRLQKDKNAIQTNINIPIEVLNAIIIKIKEDDNLPVEQKTELISKLINNKKLSDAKIIDKTEYEQSLNKILSSCPNYDLTGLVKKSVVNDVCFGCDV